MIQTIQTINRPVHLARRDTYLEQAMAQFQAGLKTPVVKARLKRLDATLYCLQAAVDHGALASRGTENHAHEKPLLHFIRMVLCGLYSVRLIMEHEAQLKDHNSPLWKFLHPAGSAGNAAGFARSSEQLLGDVAHLFAMAEEPYRDTRAAQIKALSADDRARYQKAYDGLTAHLAAHPPPQAFIPDRIFAPTLETTRG